MDHSAFCSADQAPSVANLLPLAQAVYMLQKYQKMGKITKLQPYCNKAGISETAFPWEEAEQENTLPKAFHDPLHLSQ